MENKEELKKINIEGSLIELLLYSYENNILLGGILKRQLEIKELINKTPKEEIESRVKSKSIEIENKITELTQKEREKMNDFVLKAI
jgi:hypothetical protein